MNFILSSDDEEEEVDEVPGEDEYEDEEVDDDHDNPSVMELHYRSRQAQGLQPEAVLHGRSNSPIKKADDRAGGLDEDMAMDGVEYEYY